MCKYSANFRKKSGMSKQYREKTPKSYPIMAILSRSVIATALSFKNALNFQCLWLIGI